MDLKKFAGFNVVAYKRRLKLFREVVCGENQIEFSKLLGIDFKRWNNYERGYPVPREVAFMIKKRWPGMSIEWLWFGQDGNLSQDYRDKLEKADVLLTEREAAEAAVAKAKSKLETVKAKRPARVRT